jgi:hypothetical protein
MARVGVTRTGYGYRYCQVRVVVTVLSPVTRTQPTPSAYVSSISFHTHSNTVFLLFGRSEEMRCFHSSIFIHNSNITSP